MGDIQRKLKEALLKLDQFNAVNAQEEKDKADIANELIMMIGFIGGRSEDSLPDDFCLACEDIIESIDVLCDEVPN